MIWNISGPRLDIPVSVSALGDNILVPAQAQGEIFMHEIIGDTSGAVIVTFKAGIRTLGIFNLDANQGLTLGDPAGMDGEPRYKCFPGEALIMNLSTATPFQGSLKYSIKS